MLDNVRREGVNMLRRIPLVVDAFKCVVRVVGLVDTRSIAQMTDKCPPPLLANISGIPSSPILVAKKNNIFHSLVPCQRSYKNLHVFDASGAIAK